MGQCHGLSMGMGGVRIFNPCLTPTHRGGSWVGLEGTWVGLQKSFNTLTLETLIFNYPTPLPSTQFANAPSSAHLYTLTPTVAYPYSGPTVPHTLTFTPIVAYPTPSVTGLTHSYSITSSLAGPYTLTQTVPSLAYQYIATPLPSYLYLWPHPHKPIPLQILHWPFIFHLMCVIVLKKFSIAR